MEVWDGVSESRALSLERDLHIIQANLSLLTSDIFRLLSGFIFILGMNFESPSLNVNRDPLIGLLWKC